MVALHPITVGGLTRFSTVDYPGRLSAVVFCQGCPWRCPYCHNPHLQPAGVRNGPLWTEVLDWLQTRRGMLDSVVFSGGEPLLQRGLAGAMWQVRERGFGVGLHTAGVYPDRLAGLFPLVDWVGFDVKAPFCDYPRVTGAKSGNAAQRALSYVLASGKPYEIRCTADETLLSPADAGRMAGQLVKLGVDHIVLQAKRMVNGVTLPISASFIEAMAAEIGRVELR
ncbi:anaerobic ribonucleoside-triphosphate reductase activating protein [Propionivibrio limicola]|uniref:anaerobic ribonucleoside-triphosphate reductase activating protein n=1 Tax=Propionivibrio limicola TaxID=167645 RepID=UPI0012911A15|nr:anaerobic ribonucleoside-triphosphate reductase activating protein [Propionivibrio limicola]